MSELEDGADDRPGATRAESIEVAILSDHRAIREGLGLLLGRAGMTVAAGAGELEEADTVPARAGWDVALVDLDLVGQGSSGLIADRLERGRYAPIVLYAGDAPESRLREAARAGAPGLVLKTSPPEILTEALRTVAEGGAFTDPDLPFRLARHTGARRLHALSPRELEILRLLADGLTGRGIANRLHLSPETVRTHVRNAVRKLGVKTRVQAVAVAIQEGHQR